MEVLYRKYRPKTFAEVVDQDHVKKAIIGAIQKDSVAHGYIFAGPRGTGKTTLARILAKSLNCENRKGVEPCNECRACKEIDEGTFMDVIELDAASNRGIDEIRRIRDAVGYRPMEGKYKVYIIDEVHMLTKEAFNALLKTLEEPPSHVVFVLATTNLEKVPPTIISRCQVFEFRNIPEELIEKRLQEVAEAEGIDIEEEALRFIAKRAAGGLRDALTMLEQVWKFSEGKIDLETVHRALGLVPIQVVRDYVKAIFSGDVKKVFMVLDEVYYSGKDYEVLLQEAVEDLIDDLERERGVYDVSPTDVVQVSRQLLSLLREIKFAEEKQLVCKVGSAYITARFASEKVSENPQKEKENIVQKNLGSEEKKKDENDDFDSLFRELMEELKEKGDLSIFVALSLSEVSFDGKKVVISFDSSKKMHYELMKKRLIEIESLFSKKLGKRVVVELRLMGKEETIEKVSQKIMKLFEQEG
ncbi:DNA polymerase III subunit gamma/tau [Thermotoga sp. KOL6]|uniref:DNA polymerase III subunit gamma/tau n=1 Tax=Thermotoga sp. KOL6 TaxID=126741 RepID=UPI000C76D8A6|nr:DNA polymerase III subunit gamma/tau [Thermotoga sp. KOL6]PLV59386.1 DNA polymerase III subunit gamma/tau [Thermotoga sp. KOL6]